MNATWVHHTILHFPIALLVTAGLAYLVALVHRWHGWRITGGVALVLGTGAAMVAVVSGLLDRERALAGGIPAAVVNLHMAAALITLGLAILTTLAWIVFATRKQLGMTGAATLITALTLVTAGAVIVTGHLGGSMLHPGISPLPEVRELARVEAPETATAARAADADLAEPPAPNGDVQPGAEVYANACASCHGAEGEGIAAMGAPAVLGDKALPVQPPAEAERDRPFETGADVLAYVSERMPPDAPGSLPDEDYREVVRYLLHRRGLEPPPELPDEAARAIHL